METGKASGEEPVTVTITRSKTYPTIGRPGPAHGWTWYWSYDAAASDGELFDNHDLAALRQILKSKYGHGVRIVETWNEPDPRLLENRCANANETAAFHQGGGAISPALEIAGIEVSARLDAQGVLRVVVDLDTAEEWPLGPDGSLPVVFSVPGGVVYDSRIRA